ncbi:MAG: YafY family transcriptional regulator [Candidatus Polarisedimenticolaceae bacterium]|nr:YafY family transcriptional regulator [Candidatus Polarisedimenticolaceae bacterium]
MRRADRLFQIIQLLRCRRITTAAWLAEELEVSERTIYRDIQDLILSGVPIEGEAGVGYLLRKSFDLPPLMFTLDEISALALGAGIVKSWADPQLAKAAGSVLSKVETVLPSNMKRHIDQTKLISPMRRLPADVAAKLAQVRLAIESSEKITFDYRREDGERSSRTVWPLGLFFWGVVWTLGGWCELRQEFRIFRVDRMGQLEPNGEIYPTSEGRTLQDLIAYEMAKGDGG